VNAAIAGLPDPSWKIRELCGCQEGPTGDGGLHSQNVTLIFDNNTSARWVKAAMKLYNPTHFCVVYFGQQTDSTSRAQTPMLGGRSCHHLNDLLPPPAEDMINDSWVEWDNDVGTHRPNPRMFPMT